MDGPGIEMQGTSEASSHDSGQVSRPVGGAVDERPISRPLEGIRVIDLTHALAGPTCTNLLSLLGAEVIKVERPGVGDDFRHYTEHAGLPGLSIPFAATNNGKKSITLDLSRTEGREAAIRLVEQGDVLVENFRPGVVAKLGLDWGTLSSINPRLVYASISGFGQTGRLRDWTAYDHIVQAMSGMMWMNGEPDSDPLKVGFPMIDTFTGYMGAIGILAALQKRGQSGLGDYIDVAMLDSAFNLMGGLIPTYFYTKELRQRTGNKGYRLVATSETYPTRDGFIAIGANHQHQIEALCDVLGCKSLLDDPRFKTHRGRVEHHEALRQELTAVFADLCGEEIEPRLAERHVPVAYVRNLAQVLAHPHLQERGVFMESALPSRDASIRLVGPGFQLGSGRLEAGPVPALGEHTDEVLRTIGYSDDRIDAMRADGIL